MGNVTSTTGIGGAGVGGAGVGGAGVGGGVGLPLGASCTIGVDCESGHCADSLCCNAARSFQNCRSCAAALNGGSNGVCGFNSSGTDPHMDCGADEACNGAGICKTVDGGSCSMNVDCISMNCSAGTCVP
jgi:hypothetical protein